MKTVPSHTPDREATAGVEQYRQFIESMARALAEGRTGEVVPYLAGEFRARHVELFVEGNCFKRFDLLVDMLSFLAEDEDFGEFEAWVHQFVEDVPVGAYENGSSECDSFLAWIERTKRLSSRQRDTIGCQRARHRVERLADERRTEHVRFQELCSLNERWAESLEDNLQMEIHINPARCWSELLSAKYLDEGDLPPAEVMCYASGLDVRTVLLEETARRTIDELATWQPCTLQQWIAMSQTADRDSLLALVADLAALGIVAFA